MKLEQIRINGFGILHDLSIDFEPDLTIIYGLNGSGKSTLLNFVRSVLYGFYQRGSSKRYEPLRGGSHGGSILVSDQGRRLLLSRTSDRRSGGALTIEDLNNGTSGSEDYVFRLTGGISQSLFETVYAFGLAELQQLKFLQDEDLSALLYSIGLGSSVSLAAVKDRLTEAMDSIYKVRGSRPELNTTLRSLKEHSAAIKTLGSVNKQYQELLGQIKAKQNEVSELRESLEEAKHELQQTRIMLEAWPHWQKLLIAREKLQQLPELDLPVNGLARMEAIQTDLKQLGEKQQQAKAKLPPGVELPVDGVTDLHTLIQESETLENELEQAELQLNVARERHTQIQIEYMEIENQIASAEAQIEGLGLGKLSFADLIVRKQWLEALRPQSSDRKTLPTTLKSVAQISAVCGWLVIGWLFYTASVRIGVWLTAGMSALLVVWLVSEQVFGRRRTREDALLVKDAASRLGISDIEQELPIVEHKLERAEELVKSLDQLKRNLEQHGARLAAYDQHLVKKQSQMEVVSGKLQTLLEQCNLPADWGLKEFKAWLDVMGSLPELIKQQQQLEGELEDFYSRCRSSDPAEISRFYKSQDQRSELQQEIANIEVILQTYLGRQGGQLEDTFAGHSKAALIQESEQLEAEIAVLSADLEQLQKALGGLNVKREMLEQSQRLEELQQEREILQAKAQNLAERWTSLRICQWVIEQVSRKYEQERQPEVLRLASAYFASITNQRYQRVYAPIGMQQIKIEAENGEVLEPPQLSQGTLEQLYLAIRFALAKQIAQEKVEIPIFADDILVNFDRFRLANTVELIQEISASHQIILLTCHQRIANLFDSRHVRNLDEMANSPLQARTSHRSD